ncbi:uncharacterized protein LACBIDRAFT_295727 [Laccaria bicolor S238N-H82]|uniref:Predicted protein n=1 Tax=Laccaria bicolor (strain S238N-H82 / ATCC MYA-4686) TaxID=486041 RepID=B0DXL7_LACBS|nr:uncharacterized protein LACBIDRAFT_295727 [Laccaria bicolor S238N-H82]EDR00700.1 predicted protein [Laccaria bicolor S238N-H82]|eukprot:XP_001888709.1 predicted protein [Laccaria bicolor S238N-H82]
MVKFYAALFIAVAIAALALAIPIEKEHARELQAESMYQRGLDAEDLSLSVRDFHEGDLSRREVNHDLVERDPKFNPKFRFSFGNIFKGVGKAFSRFGKSSRTEAVAGMTPWQ